MSHSPEGESESLAAFKRTARLLIRRGPLWAAYAGVLLLVLMQVPWLDDPIKDVGFRDTDQFRTVIVVLVLSGLMLELHDLSQRISPTPGHRQHFINPDDMYHARSHGCAGPRGPQTAGSTYSG